MPGDFKTPPPPKVGAVVSFCSHERPFLAPQMRELLRCVDSIVYCIGSHTYDGTPDAHAARAMIAKALKHEPEPDRGRVKVAEYAVTSPECVHSPRTFHNLARQTGVNALDPSVEWLLFLDADEIPSAPHFRAWFQKCHVHLMPRVVYKMACYWYFKSPAWRARTLEDSIVLAHRAALSAPALADPRERDGIVAHAPGGCLRFIASHEGNEPMFHHFSWVRSHDALLAKIKTWGHKGDKTDDKWAAIIRSIASMSAPPAEGDPVHGYTYDVLETGPMFGIRVVT